MRNPAIAEETGACSTKTCRRCSEEKPTTEFGKTKRSADGFEYYCRACRADQVRAWREANPEHAKEVQRRSWHKHREKRLAEMRERASAPWWRAWREAYKPRMRELRMGYYRKDPEKYKRATAEWRILNRERAREYCRKYRIQNPETVQINGQVRRARKFNATRGKPSAIRAFIKEMRTTKRLRCYWCGVSTKKGERHVDHIIPLSRGGAHARENLCCACVSCNLAKGAKLPFEFSGQAEMSF